jgi:hypothetical protein
MVQYTPRQVDGCPKLGGRKTTSLVKRVAALMEMPERPEPTGGVIVHREAAL